MNDPFEERLAALPRREVPPEWHDAILSASPSQHRRPRVPSWLALNQFFWPHPYAWAAVAVLWIAILALNLSGPRGDDLYATSTPSQPTRENQIAGYIMHLRLQKLLLAQTQPVAPWKEPQDL